MALLPGDMIASFRAPNGSNPNYVFDSAAGRYLLLAVLSGADDETVRAGVDRTLAAARAGFDDLNMAFFALVPDNARWRAEGVDQMPGVRFLFDNGEVRALLEVGDAPSWILLDPQMRVLSVAPAQGLDQLLATLPRLPVPDMHGGLPSFAPVLVVPRVFEPAFCKTLIDLYNETGGEESGFMREIDGMTRLVNDPKHKRRRDVMVEDEGLIAQCRARIQRRLVPQIAKAFQYKATRMERYLVACYDAETGGHFRAHRDNTTKGTAHRRFAVSINLNHEFEGGDLRFAEYGNQTYRPPVGGAVVFSCSLLHEATPVTQGTRYAFLPFLYDEAAAHVRAENQKFLAGPGFDAELAQPEPATA